MKQFLVICLAFSQIFASMAVAADLPDLGNPANTALNKAEAAQIGRSVMARLRQAGAVVDDPLLTEYIQTLGHRLSSLATDGSQSFHFFVVDNKVINAFSLPGGYIGVNSGLILATADESELAAVLAHEISHITQRHIARAIYDAQRTSLLSVASMIAGILLGAAAGAGGDAMAGIVTASQAAAAQHQISFTRQNEEEADRIGIKLLSDAGFDPDAMGDFFEKLARRYGASERAIPQMLQDHPVTAQRIAEARARARQLPPAHPTDSRGYRLAKARLTVLMAPTATAALNKIESEPDQTAAATRYARALALEGMALNDKAHKVFVGLVSEFPQVIAYRIGEAEALAHNHLYPQAIRVYQDAIGLFPRNVPLNVSYAKTLLAAGKPDQAHQVLLKLYNQFPPTPSQIRLIARAADAGGDKAEAHYYMSEYYVSVGNLPLAIKQLRQALRTPDTDPIQHARYTARLDELASHLSDDQRDKLDKLDKSSGAG